MAIQRLYLMLFIGFVLTVNKNVHAQKIPLTKQIGLSHDNDVFRLEQNSDRNYSFGLILNYTTVTSNDNFFNYFFKKVGFSKSEKFVFDNMIYLKGFTPEFDIESPNGSYRPFAGVLNWESSVYLSNETRLWRFGTLIGVRGRISGAEWVQDSFHDLITNDKFEGWKYQLPNKLLVGITGSFVKPWELNQWVGIFSESQLSISNFQFFLQENIGLRVGRFNTINNSSMYFGNLNSEIRNRNEFFFVLKFFGKAIFTDTTLSKEGQSQDFPNPLDMKNFQAGYQIAFRIQSGRFGSGISHTGNSVESNVSGNHSYGTLAIYYSFN